MWGKNDRGQGEVDDAPAERTAGELVQLNGAAGALAGATSLEDIKAIRDKAEAARRRPRGYEATSHPSRKVSEPLENKRYLDRTTPFGKLNA